MKDTKGKLVILLIASTLSFYSCQNETKYSGHISEKYLLHKNNGGVYNVVFYSDSLRKNININVTADCYVNLSVGQKCYFELTQSQTGE